MRKGGLRTALFMGAVAAGLLQGAGCLSMPTSEVGFGGSGVLVADSLTGTWLVGLDTANLAPFEVILFKVADESGSARLSGVSRLPEFASGMGMTLLQPGPLQVEIAGRNVVLRGLTLRDRPLVFIGSACGKDLCGAVLTDSSPGAFVDIARASRDWAVAFANGYSEPAAGLAPVAGAVFVLRLDDAQIEDTLSMRLATELNLPVSLAIPTGLVGDPSHLGWSRVELFAEQNGGLPVVHSRTHGSAPSGVVTALKEFAQPKEDFETRGLAPLFFVQPGEWGGELRFDSLSKYSSRYGVMLDHLYVGMHAYVQPAFRVSPSDRVDLLGRTHWTLDGMTSAGVEQYINAVRSKVGVGVWLWHSEMVNRGLLEYFLRRVASLRDSGIVDVLSPAGELLLRQARPAWDGAAVSGTVPRHVPTSAAVSGAVCPESLLVTGWELDLLPGCAIRVPVALLQPGWPVRAVVRWSGQTRLRVRVIPATRLVDGGAIVTDTARDVITQTFAYLTPRLGDREVIVALENVGVADIHISAFHFSFF